MKKALVMTFVLVLGLGAAAFAAPLSGSWDTSISIDPSAVVMTDFFVSFSSTLAVDFTVGGWTFGSSSTFSQVGYSAQSFTAAGVLGAFSFDSTMNFAPMAVTETVYATLTTSEMAILFGAAAAAQTAPKNLFWNACPVFVAVDTVGPVFDDWTVSGSVSIAGVSFEGLFFLEGWGGGTTTTTMGYFHWDGEGSYEQTGSTVVAAGNTGAGWRFMVSGDVAPGVILTSYTYFNLSQADATSTVGCPVIGKKSTYSIANDDCNVAFTEEYITLEGLGFGCVDIDLALKLTCDGFEYLKIVIAEIPFLSWVDLQLGITFTEISKDLTLCGSLGALGGDCFSIDVGLNTISAGGAVITELEIYGISVEYTWNGLTFSSDTSFNTTKHAIKDNIYGPDEIAFLVPLTGMVELSTCDDPCETFVVETEVCSITADGVGYYEFVCIATEYYEVWESFGIEADGDSCCGGLFDFSIINYFGTRYVLGAYAWAYFCDDVEPVDSLVVYDPTVLLGLADFATYAEFTYTTHDALWVEAVYSATAGAGTLFGWVETELEAEIGLASNFSITFGLGVNVYGWESLDFGFELTF